MKVLVCGSRTWTDTLPIRNRMTKLFLDAPVGSRPTVIHGGAPGADVLAGHEARKLGMKVHVFPADWKKHGKRAGILRNLKMLEEEPDLVLAFWDGKSFGTAHTISVAKERNIPIEIIR